MWVYSDPREDDVQQHSRFPRVSKGTWCEFAGGNEALLPVLAGRGDGSLDFGDIRIGERHIDGGVKLVIRSEASRGPFKAAGAARDREVRDRFGKIRWNGMSLHVEEKHVPIGCGKRENSRRGRQSYIDHNISSQSVMPDMSCLALCCRAFVCEWELKQPLGNDPHLFAFVWDLVASHRRRGKG
jgi:hypothetical protein